MSGQRWGSFPNWWVLAGGLKQMHNMAANGRHVAALRVYLGLALLANFETRAATTTVTDLETITGLSRPMVIKGLRFLENFAIVPTDPKPKGSVDSLDSLPELLGEPMCAERAKPPIPVMTTKRAGRRCEYTLDRAGSKQFAKVPRDLLRKELSRLPTRGASALDALKLYITLVSIRSNPSDRVVVSHSRLIHHTGIRPDRLRSAVDVLFEHRLIHLDSTESDTAGHPVKVYQLRGLAERVISTTAASTEASAGV